MNAIAATLRPIPFPSLTRLKDDPVAQVFNLLRIGFVVLPILMGLDKFAEVMNDELAGLSGHRVQRHHSRRPPRTRCTRSASSRSWPGSSSSSCPRFGGLLVAGWLGGIIISLLLVGGYGDIALRDFGLLLGALALFRLAGADSSLPTDRGAATASRPPGLERRPGRPLIRASRPSA